MSDPQVTGPNDDGELGHGGVDVPTEDIDTLPELGDDADPAGSIGGGDGGGGSDALGGERDDTL